MIRTATISKDRPRRDAVLSALKALEPELKARGVGHLYLFGSVARDEAAPGSDVDLFFDHGESPLSLVRMIGVRRFLQERMGAQFDLMSRNSLHPLHKSGVESEALKVF